MVSFKAYGQGKGFGWISSLSFLDLLLQEFLGVATNCVAEYRGALRGISKAINLGFRKIWVESDSTSVVYNLLLTIGLLSNILQHIWDIYSIVIDITTCYWPISRGLRYVLVYFPILYIRYHAGIVTDEMLSLPKTPFLLVGLLQALGAASGMAAGAMLSGASIPILSQTFLVWQILLSIIFLGRRYRFNQIVGCFLVSVGVLVTVASGSGGGLSLKEAGIFWTLLMITSFLFQAADTVLKEIIFLNAPRQLKVCIMALDHQQSYCFPISC
ncbi:hypothetical protein NE237_003655 [Protea cynaroides]|uniref:RNase H type-1 domain-containing protein n=1 Tax=Protea cynaroides TaxID=273540 RepID=A0A9Q0KHH4_9MAGN|nr:hypothetical protein NE237_003655 [Protea cynaroides]